MSHYICTGTCKGVAIEEGVCQAIECSKYGEPLVICNCNDGNHQDSQRTEGA